MKMRPIYVRATRIAAVVIAIGCGLFSTVDLAGDTVYLKKGGHITGVVSKKSDTSIEIKSNMGTIVLSKGAIDRIEKTSEKDNKALESQWKQERDKEKAKAKEAKLFEAEQRAKGYVKFHGTWVPAEKVYEAEQGITKEREEWEKTVEQQKRELQEMEQRLKELETALEQRQRDLEFKEQQLALREQNLLLQQQNLQQQADQLARDRKQSPPKMFAIPRVEVVPAGGQP
ncbi:MAG: hypothetical protein P8123_10295 [bacterium]